MWRGDNTVSINEPDELNEIIECFGTNLTVRTGFYDVMSTGGCNGIHWNTAFGIVFFSEESEFSMGFGDCSGGITITDISKEFVKYDDTDTFKKLFFNYGHYFAVGCDEEKLLKAMSKHIGNIAINDQIMGDF